MKFRDSFDKIIAVVKETEVIKKQFDGSKSKKEYAVDLIDTVVDIPILPDKLIIGFCVDLVVLLFNKYNLFDK